VYSRRSKPSASVSHLESYVLMDTHDAATFEGMFVGMVLGMFVGSLVGSFMGSIVGMFVGSFEGLFLMFVGNFSQSHVVGISYELDGGKNCYDDYNCHPNHADSIESFVISAGAGRRMHKMKEYSDTSDLTVTCTIASDK
jgi:hypothetical protein